MRELHRAFGAIVVTSTLAAVAAGCGSDSGSGRAAGEGPRASLVTAGDTSPRSTLPSSAPVQVRDDAEAALSNAAPAGAKLTERAPSPDRADVADAKRAPVETKANFISPGAPSDAEIAAELRQLDAVQKQQSRETSQVSGTEAGGVTLRPDGTAEVGPDVPEVVARVVAGANAIAKFPYVYGGGHGSFIDTAYDCSGSLSYALAAGGLVKTTLVSGQLAKQGEPGPGKWITIYANEGHTFMVVGGLRFDTSGRDGPLGSRWQRDPRSTKGLEVRHPPGL